ncbi:glycerate kinase [Raineyella sp. LH-20]|uniref:glycerate kinase n=1 Tax=Raineyella sp. LH-20 TaxID=3081204 RepID=UPI00295349F6|nr:glycerate kinase [Raineyella sp. LH-20]WOP18249.1 glycerate kinase [Raineyella sp. LH-20]
MRIVCAPDSFKESMTAAEAAAAMARGVRRVLPDAEIVEVPLSDGGEGFLESLAAALDARLVPIEVPDALGRPVMSSYALTADGLAVIEMARAAGLEQIAPTDRDVHHSSTAGVGRLVTAALDAGATRLVIGIGGSATNDGGAGLLDALGVRYLDADGRRLVPTPAGLVGVAAVDASGLDPRLAAVTVDVACDVTNPLCGPYGASAVFGPQKGATAEDVRSLDAVLARLARLDGGTDVADQPGAGAAGGLGYALLRHLQARLRPGIELVTETVGLAQAVRGAALVLTGEGSVDAQSLAGKTPVGVAAIAAAAGVDTVILAGRVAPDTDVLLDHGVLALVPILPRAMDLDEALATGVDNLERAAATVIRLVFRGGRAGRASD